MATATLLDVVPELLSAIKLLAGYPIPERLPEMHLVSPLEIQQMLCKGDCGIKAFYMPDKGVFVSNAIGSLEDAFTRSVVLHELVHHLQHVSGKFDMVADKCDRWYSKEREAYEVQNAYLQREGEKRRFLIDSLPHMCGDRD
jgi:hypothetical protein